MSWLGPAIAALLIVLWLVMGRLYIAASRQVRILSDELGGTDPVGNAADRLPSVSIVITARDEAASIAATVGRALAQRHPALEVVVVDDRSTDGTGEILDRLTGQAAGTGSGDPPPRLEVIHVRDLPAGWLGKCHACKVGAERSRGAWLLFMDGDVTLDAADLVARVEALAEGRRLDHVAVLPDLRPYGPLQAALLFGFEQALLLTARVWEMERDRPRGGAGVGAFNLVRRSAYDRIGGHALLRMEVADDFKLGMLLKESGARQRIYSGLGLLSCPWHRGAWAVVRGLEKNLFAGVSYSLGAILAQTLLALLVQTGPPILALLVGIGAGRPWGFAPLAVALATLLAASASAARRLATRPALLFLLYPIAAPMLLLAVWNSTIATLRRGGVRWRDTWYPLADLRRGTVRPGSGRRFRPAA